MVFQEGELRFDFSKSLHAERFDQQGVPKPEGMMLVDFLVEETERILLIEVKDPSTSRAHPKAVRTFEQKLESKALVNDNLVPKGRDSYTFLHLMRRDDKPITYLVVLGLDESRTNDPALLSALNDHFRQRLSQESSQPWKKQYVLHSAILTLEEWNRRIPQYPISRGAPA